MKPANPKNPEPRSRQKEFPETSAEFFQAVMDSLSVHIAILDQEGNILNVNKTWMDFACKNGLVAPGGESNRNYFEVCRKATGDFSEQAPMAEEGIREILEGKARERFRKWMFALVAHYNITQRKLLELANEEQLEISRKIIETSPAGITVLDRQGRIVFANRIAEEVLGIEKDELTGLKYNAPEFEITDEQGAPVPDEQLPFVQILRSKKARSGMSHAIVWPDGQKKILLINGAPILDDEGEVERVVFTLEDITEQIRSRETSQLLSNLVASSEDAILGKDLDGMIQTWNRGAEQIYGYSAEEAVGRHISFLLPEDRKEEFETLSDKIRKGEKVEHYETERVRKDGQVINVSVTLSPIRDNHERVIGLSSVTRDITVRKQAERARQRENESWQRISSLSETSITAGSLGQQPLMNSFPDLYEKLLSRYENLLMKALERRVYKEDNSRLENGLTTMAEQLGSVKAGPRDILNIHVAALKKLTQNLSSQKKIACADEGRLMALELMGYLVSYYRNHAIAYTNDIQARHSLNQGGEDG